MSCAFKKNLLLPRYWVTWFGLAILWLIVQLPYPVLHTLGTSAGRLSRRVMVVGIHFMSLELGG
ncbi:hypothetical protein CJ207_26075, partial [Klebsiella aerogenes]